MTAVNKEEWGDHGLLLIWWTQNNCELQKRHSKRGNKMERKRGKQDGEESV
jgi:hypothetical protein